MERAAGKHTPSYVKQIASGNLLFASGSSNWCPMTDNLEGWDGVGGGREVQKEGTYVYLWLIHVDVWQKPRQHCKATIPQLKIICF